VSNRELLDRTGAVLVAHSRTDLALRCIVTLRELRPENLVVVVNAPEPTNRVCVQRLEEAAIVVSPPTNQGYGANLNLGVRSLPKGLDFLLLANDDLEFAEGSLRKLVETLEEHPDTAAVGPALVDLHGRQQAGLLTAPAPSTILLDFARLLPLHSAWPRLEGMAHRRAQALGRPAQWISGAAMLVRADAFRSVGGFDEDFFLYYEETDLCVRLHEAGWRVAWRPDAAVLHVGGASTGPGNWTLFLQSRRLYLSKRQGGLRLVALQVVLVAVFIVGALYNLVGAAIRPRTARRRFDLLQEVWRWRPFLLGPRIGR
jgi:N-acetylglucosaminyl-diphospho-decaprenol L-rhamnosyltransferase